MFPLEFVVQRLLFFRGLLRGIGRWRDGNGFIKEPDPVRELFAGDLLLTLNERSRGEPFDEALAFTRSTFQPAFRDLVEQLALEVEIDSAPQRLGRVPLLRSRVRQHDHITGREVADLLDDLFLLQLEMQFVSVTAVEVVTSSTDADGRSRLESLDGASHIAPKLGQVFGHFDVPRHQRAVLRESRVARCLLSQCKGRIPVTRRQQLRQRGPVSRVGERQRQRIDGRCDRLGHLGRIIVRLRFIGLRNDSFRGDRLAHERPAPRGAVVQSHEEQIASRARVVAVEQPLLVLRHPELPVPRADVVVR